MPSRGQSRYFAAMEQAMRSGAGVERFLAYVPGPVRQVLQGRSVPLLSSDLIAQYAPMFGGPVLEVTWPGPDLLAAVLRAVRYTDGILAVVVPASVRAEGPRASRQVAQAILDVAEDCLHDRPLMVVSPAWSLANFEGDRVERMLSAVHVEIAAGITSIGLDLGRTEVENCPARVWRVLNPIAENGIGVELEFHDPHRASLMLAQMDQVGLEVAAVSGVTEDDELCGGLLRVDPVTDPIPNEVAFRFLIDGFVLQAIVKALGKENSTRLLDDVATFGPAHALSANASSIACFPDKLRDRLVAFTHAALQDRIVRIGAAGVASDLLDALVAERN